MKKVLLIIVLTIIVTPSLLGKTKTTDPTNKAQITSIERDKLISITATCFESNNYFKLKMLNESKAGFYSMARIYADGTIESVAIKRITVNTINQPLLYCFADKQTPNVDCTYALYRISEKNEMLQLWYYDAAKKTIRKHHEVQASILLENQVSLSGPQSPLTITP